MTELHQKSNTKNMPTISGNPRAQQQQSFSSVVTGAGLYTSLFLPDRYRSCDCAILPATPVDESCVRSSSGALSLSPNHPNFLSRLLGVPPQYIFVPTMTDLVDDEDLPVELSVARTNQVTCRFKHRYDPERYADLDKNTRDWFAVIPKVNTNKSPQLFGYKLKLIMQLELRRMMFKIVPRELPGAPDKS